MESENVITLKPNQISITNSLSKAYSFLDQCFSARACFGFPPQKKAQRRQHLEILLIVQLSQGSYWHNGHSRAPLVTWHCGSPLQGALCVSSNPRIYGTGEERRSLDTINLLELAKTFPLRLGLRCRCSLIRLVGWNGNRSNRETSLWLLSWRADGTHTQTYIHTHTHNSREFV